MDGYQDADLYFYVNFAALYPPGSIPGGFVPYVVTCDTVGLFRIPGSTEQSQFIDAGGRITNLSNLAAETDRSVDCTDGRFRALPKSLDIGAKGYYIRFTPDAGEHGAAYSRIGFLVDAGQGTSVPYQFLFVTINILPGLPPPP